MKVTISKGVLFKDFVKVMQELEAKAITRILPETNISPFELDMEI